MQEGGFVVQDWPFEARTTSDKDYIQAGENKLGEGGIDQNGTTP
jgi:hypothetical protein